MSSLEKQAARLSETQPHRPSPTSPWPDLPYDLTEHILVRLPLSDYIRFAAVCTKWRSLQTSHRLRHSPHPPPTLPLPWLFPSSSSSSPSPSSTVVTCYSPFEQKLYRFQLSHRLEIYHKFFFSHGWLILLSGFSTSFLFNPISQLQIQIPQLPASSVALSSSPTNPDCSILAIDGGCSDCGYTLFFLLRLGQPYWTLLHSLPSYASQLNSPISYRGKFYCPVERSTEDAIDLFVVDPSPVVPIVECFEMDGGDFECPNEYDTRVFVNYYTVECNGDLLLVLKYERYRGRDRTPVQLDFRLFKADLARKVWVRVESLGDRVLLLDASFSSSSSSSVAADLGVQKNCILFYNHLWKGWKVFDIEMKTVTDDAPIPEIASQNDYCWFLPTIC